MPNSDNSSRLHIYSMRHSCEHALTMAMLRIWGNKIKAAMGPATDDGFYFDFDSEIKISEDDFPKIEREMAKIIKENLPITKDEMTAEEARKFFSQGTYEGNQYKHEWLDAIKSRDEKVGVYWMGEKGKDIPDTFVDICAGPHVKSTNQIGAFKLIKIAGAYWHGDEKNAMLQRIYGTCFETKEELDAYLKQMEEAKKRDHKVLGRKLDLFTFSDLVGPGLPLWTPRGTILRGLLDDFVWQLRKAKGYERVEIPHIAKADLYIASGHWDKFKDELFKIKSREGHEFAMKPMNCPHHIQIFKRQPYSYKNMPQRYANTTMCYRDEQTGELAGISRTRSFTQDDAHVFCRKNQIEEEFLKIWDIVDEFYNTCNFELNVRLSLHDPENFDKYLGDRKIWESAEGQLRALAKKRGVKVTEQLGEAAFYGPKIDFVAKDSIGREWQVATIQLDMNMPERFDLTCVNEESKKERIFIIHAAIMGSIERFLSILIEHYAGAFPFWLAPVQIRILPISDNFLGYAREVEAGLRGIGVRVEVDDAAEGLGKKIRNAEMMKIPFMLVVGEKEAATKSVAVRDYNTKEQKVTALKDFLMSVEKMMAKKV